MATTTVTRTVVFPADSVWTLLVDTSSKKKVYITPWLDNADGRLLLRYQEALPDPGDLPDAILPKLQTFPEAVERYTGKIWCQVFNWDADDFVLVAELDYRAS